MALTSQIGDRFKAELAGQIVTTISGAILITALARLLDPDQYGILFLAISVIGIVEIFSKLGIGKSAARYIAEYKETDPTQLPVILRFSLGINLVSILIVGLLLVAMSGTISSLLGEPELTPFLSVGAVFVAFTTLMTYSRLTLQGFEEIQFAALLLAAERSGRLIFAFAFVLLGYGAIGAFSGYVLAAAVTAPIGLGYLYLRYYRNAKREQTDRGIRRRIVRYTVPLTATSTANVLDNRIDTVLVGFFIGPVAVAYYTLGKQVVTFIETPMSALGFTLAPTYEAERAKGNREAAARMYEQALSHGLLLYIPAAAGLIFTAEPLVRFVFGTEYLEAVPVLQVLAIYAIFHAVTKLTSDGLDFLGRARERAIIKGITSVSNFALNIALIPLIGVIGAAIATVFTHGVYALANVYIIKLELDLRVAWLLRHLVTVLAISGVMSLTLYFGIEYITGLLTLVAVVIVEIVLWMGLAVASGVLDVRNLVASL